MRRLISCAAAVCVCLCLLMALPVSAQTPTPITISLDSASLELQTGKEYEVNIWLDNAADVWLANAEIAYDPALMYIMGTKSGQPVRQGPLFDLNQSVVVRNFVQGDQLIYTLSMLAPGLPVSGSGIVGTFRIYPLGPGDAQLTFKRVTLNKVNQIVENGTPVKTETEDLPFVAAMIQFRITGDPVSIPSEATATPAPTETPFMATAIPMNVEPTLVNVTAAPRQTLEATPASITTVPDAADAATSPLPMIAIALVAVGLIGLVVLFVMYQRR